MKRVEELGISSWPWHTCDDNWVESADGSPAMSNSAYACNQHDARLIAAAPELYEALRELCEETCLNCEYSARYDKINCEAVRPYCSVLQCHEVLAKASGEDEE